MNERIKLVRTELGLSQEEFASQLGLSRNYISLIESGKRIPAESTVILISNKFNYSEKWLLTGEGLPYEAPAGGKEAEIGKIVGKLFNGDDERKMRLVSALVNLTEDEWDVLYKLAESLYEKQKEEV